MRNWPYAWADAQASESPVRGKIAVSALPTSNGEAGFGALGGWQLAMNAHSHPSKRDAVAALMSHLAGASTAVTLALAYGRMPARKAAYEDPRLRQGAPFIAELLPIVERAKPRPVTPYYPMITDTLQSEFSAAIAGIRSPRLALSRAQTLVDRMRVTL